MKKEGGKRMLWAGMQTSKDAAQNNQFHELEGLAELFNLPIKKISAGYAHTLILTGEVYTFGNESHSTGNWQEPHAVRLTFEGYEVVRVVDIAASFGHSILVTEVGEVWLFRSSDESSANSGLRPDKDIRSRLPHFGKTGRFAIAATVDTNRTAILTDDNELVCYGSYWTSSIRRSYTYQLPRDLKIAHFCLQGPEVTIVSDTGQVYTYRKGQQLVARDYFFGAWIVRIETRGHRTWAFTGHPAWTTSTHHFYPKDFKDAVRTLLLCHQTRHDTAEPYHPESPITLLPMEILFNIILQLSLITSGNKRVWMRYQNQSFQLDTRGEEIVDISAGSDHCMILTARGEVLFAGGHSLGQFGMDLPKSSSEVLPPPPPIKSTSLSSHTVSRICAGAYHSIVAV